MKTLEDVMQERIDTQAKMLREYRKQVDELTHINFLLKQQVQLLELEKQLSINYVVQPSLS